MDEQTPAPERLGRVYDRIGRVQDWQGFYEGPAIRDLVASAGFGHADAVLELGCGTGAMARALLDDVLPTDASYVGVDVSATMVELASDRLARFGDRADVSLVDGRVADRPHERRHRVGGPVPGHRRLPGRLTSPGPGAT